MKRLKSPRAWMPVLWALASGCIGANNPWAARQEPAGAQDAPVVATEVEETVQQGRMPNSDTPPGTMEDDSTDAVATFIRRLQSDDPQAVESTPDMAGLEELPAVDFATGAAGASANRSLAIPPPGQEGAFPAPVAKPAQATQAPRIEAVSVVTPRPGPDEKSETRITLGLRS